MHIEIKVSYCGPEFDGSQTLSVESAEDFKVKFFSILRFLEIRYLNLLSRSSPLSVEMTAGEALIILESEEGKKNSEAALIIDTISSALPLGIT